MMDNKINRQHGSCLRIIYNDKTLPFMNLLAKDGSVTIYTINFLVLVNKKFEVHKNMSRKN